jgi:3-oxoacyl-[acyl-carrier-protein] synthase-3
MRRVGVCGTGSCVPDRRVGNDEVGPPAGVDDAWIRRKTQVRERRWISPGQTTSDLAAAAGRAALDAAGVAVRDLSLIVVATSTPDRSQPPTAAYVHRALGADPAAAAFDVNAVCSGFVFALASAAGQLCEDQYALAIGADVYSRILDPADRRTVVLFGDGAGAAVLGSRSDGRVVDCRMRTYGALTDLITVPPGGYFEMEGRAVREFVADTLPGVVKQFLADNDVAPEAVVHLVPHQANGVMLDQMACDLGLPDVKLHRTVSDLGNTGAASIPLTLDRAARSGALHPGELVLLAGFGGGMSIGLALLEWGGQP